METMDAKMPRNFEMNSDVEAEGLAEQ